MTDIGLGVGPGDWKRAFFSIKIVKDEGRLYKDSNNTGASFLFYAKPKIDEG